jgi:hypothetical protein
MARYRRIFHNHQTGTTDTADVEYDTDEQAIAGALKRAGGSTVMTWHDDRWIGTFAGSGS